MSSNIHSPSRNPEHESLDISDGGQDPTADGEIRNNGGVLRAQSNGIVDDVFNGVDYTNDEIITSQSDLPSPQNGTIPLEDGVAYRLDGFVTIDTPLSWSGTPVIYGRHASVDGFIYTGGGTMLQGTGPFMAESCYLHAPGGTLFGLDADNTTEMLVQNCGFSDAAGLGNMSSLGTINGYRVPTFKGCNFEQFDAGITFDGDPDKIFFSTSPFRGVTASNVSIFTLASTSSCNIVDFANNYVKDVQSDTNIWHIESGGEPSEVFQYRGTTHDTSVNVDNILTGPNTGAQQEPFWVSDSHPLRQSSVIGELSQDSNTSVTFPSSGTFVSIGGSTTLGNESERVDSPTNGQLRSQASRKTNVHITTSIQLTGSNAPTYNVGIAKNGTVEPTSIVKIDTGKQNEPYSANPNAIEDLATGDTIEPVIENQTDTTGITVTTRTVTFMG